MSSALLPRASVSRLPPSAHCRLGSPRPTSCPRPATSYLFRVPSTALPDRTRSVVAYLPWLCFFRRVTVPYSCLLISSDITYMSTTSLTTGTTRPHPQNPPRRDGTQRFYRTTRHQPAHNSTPTRRRPPNITPYSYIAYRYISTRLIVLRHRRTDRSLPFSTCLFILRSAYTIRACNSDLPFGRHFCHLPRYGPHFEICVPKASGLSGLRQSGLSSSEPRGNPPRDPAATRHPSTHGDR